MLDAMPDDDNISITLDFLQDEVDYESDESQTSLSESQPQALMVGPETNLTNDFNKTGRAMKCVRNAIFLNW